MGLFQETRTTRVRDQLLALHSVVLSRLHQKHFLELLFVEFSRVFAHFDQHLDGGTDLGLLDDFAFALGADFFDEELDEPLLNGGVLDHVVLELRVLHVFHQRQVELGHVVLVHVQEDVTDHHDALLDFLPDAVELTEEQVVVGEFDVLGNWLEQLDGGVLDAVVEHLPVLVENEAVGRAVELLVRETARLLVVDLVDRVLDRFPVLLRLRALHVCVAHLVTVNQKLVGW